MAWDFLFSVVERDEMQLTPGFFDALVLVVVAVGLVLAAIRIRHDFRSGPRFTGEMNTVPRPKTRVVASEGNKGKHP